MTLYARRVKRVTDEEAVKTYGIMVAALKVLFSSEPNPCEEGIGTAAPT